MASASPSRRFWDRSAVSTVPVNRTVPRWRARSEVVEGDLRRWREIISALPDVRLDKVRSTRQALQGNRYEGESMIEETVRRLCNDVGALCRKDLRTGPI